MAASILTRQEFATQLAEESRTGEDPIIVLENGAPAHVWLSYKMFDSLQQGEPVSLRNLSLERSLVDVFDHPAFDADTEELEIPQLNLRLEGVDLPSCS